MDFFRLHSWSLVFLMCYSFKWSCGFSAFSSISLFSAIFSSPCVSRRTRHKEEKKGHDCSHVLIPRSPYRTKEDSPHRLLIVSALPTDPRQEIRPSSERMCKYLIVRSAWQRIGCFTVEELVCKIFFVHRFNVYTVNL